MNLNISNINKGNLKIVDFYPEKVEYKYYDINKMNSLGVLEKEKEICDAIIKNKNKRNEDPEEWYYIKLSIDDKINFITSIIEFGVWDFEIYKTKIKEEYIWESKLLFFLEKDPNLKQKQKSLLKERINNRKKIIEEELTRNSDEEAVEEEQKIFIGKEEEKTEIVLKKDSSSEISVTQTISVNKNVEHYPEHVKSQYILENKNNNSSNYKVFFLVSNKTAINNSIEYSIQNKKEFINFKKVFQTNYEYKYTYYTISIFSFEIVSKYLNDKDKDKQTQKYKSKIILKYNKTNFEGTLFFKRDENNFIYDLFFGIHNGIFGQYKCPPESLNYISKLKKFIIFKEMLEKNDFKKDRKLYQDFIHDFEKNIISFKDGKKTFNFFIYLEIFISVYSEEKVKDILMMFKPNDSDVIFIGEDEEDKKKRKIFIYFKFFRKKS